MISQHSQRMKALLPTVLKASLLLGTFYGSKSVGLRTSSICIPFLFRGGQIFVERGFTTILDVTKSQKRVGIDDNNIELSIDPSLSKSNNDSFIPPSQDITTTTTFPEEANNTMPIHLANSTTSSLDGLNSTDISNNNMNATSDIDPEIARMMKLYPGKFIPITSPVAPHCDIFLCGTLHVSKGSIEMVQDVIRSLRPEYVVLELCEARIEGLIEERPILSTDPNKRPADTLTFRDVIVNSWKDKSLKTLGMGLLMWMQVKASQLTGSQLGGELIVGCREAHQLQSTVILGDRLYGITVQRLFDRMSLWQKLKMVFLISWEVITMSMQKLTEYIQQTQHDVEFVQNEIEAFSHAFPEIADVVIHERDEYMAYILMDLAGQATARNALLPSIKPLATTTDKLASSGVLKMPRSRIVSIVGAGHLVGLQKHLASTVQISDERMTEISRSKKLPSSWEGPGMLAIVDTKKLYSKKFY